jgi:Septum formation initiator
MVLYRRIGFVTATAVLTGYAAVTLLGPQGFFSLRERYQEIRRVERENADIDRGNKELRALIEKVRDSRSQREIIVKDKLKYTFKNEHQFVLSDSSSKPPQSEPPPVDPQ